MHAYSQQHTPQDTRTGLHRLLAALGLVPQAEPIPALSRWRSTGR